MPTIPQYKTLTNSSVEVLNAIRNSASTNYREYIPVATEDAECIRKIGAIMMDYPALQNEFLSALINRIGKVLITSKTYQNPWRMFKRGMLDFGEAVEEIFVELAKPFEYDPAIAETNLYKRENPNVRSAFHVLNYQKFYKDTIMKNQLKFAFLSMDGVTNLITKIIESMYTSANYDEFQVMKYMLARQLLDGAIKVQGFSDVTPASNVADIKAISNDMTFMGTEYNRAGVHTYADKADQYLIMNSSFDATVDVNVLASAFNMDKAQFMGQRVLVDGFGRLDTARLNELFANDPNYVPITDDELEALNAIPAILVDKDYFMIFDDLMEFTELDNKEGLYWNYWLHVWKIFSVSPFANAVAFMPSTATPAVQNISVSPFTAYVAPNGTAHFTADVTTVGFAPTQVEWRVTDASGNPIDYAEIDANGNLHILKDGETFADFRVYAKSVFDPSMEDYGTVKCSQTVSGVTASGTTTGAPGSAKTLTATVAATGGANGKVTAALSGTHADEFEIVSVLYNDDYTSTITWKAKSDATATHTATITIKSEFDASKSVTKTLTVGS